MIYKSARGIPGFASVRKKSESHIRLKVRIKEANLSLAWMG
jgi:hypothetical protein